MKIETLVAAFALEPDGSEGICGALTDTGWMPLICSKNDRRMAKIMMMAERIAAETGREIRIVEFTTRTVVETIKPRVKQ